MSILTKLFTVFLVIGSILVTTVAVSITAQTTNWRQNYTTTAEQLRVADITIRNLNAATAAQIATLRDAQNAAEAQITQLMGERDKSREEASNLRVQLNQAVADRAGAEAMNRGLLNQLAVSESNAEQYRGQRDTLEARNMELERRNIDLNERVNEETARIAVLMEQRRQYEQQINILRTENDALSRQARAVSTGGQLEDPRGAGLPQVTALTPVSGTAVRGQVLEVDGDIVTLSVGSADGVTNDMVFVIYRDSQYIGDLRISAVEPDKAAGRLIRSAASPQPSDRVIDEAHLRATEG